MLTTSLVVPSPRASSSLTEMRAMHCGNPCPARLRPTPSPTATALVCSPRALRSLSTRLAAAGLKHWASEDRILGPDPNDSGRGPKRWLWGAVEPDLSGLVRSPAPAAGRPAPFVARASAQSAQVRIHPRSAWGVAWVDTLPTAADSDTDAGTAAEQSPRHLPVTTPNRHWAC